MHPLWRVKTHDVDAWQDIVDALGAVHTQLSRCCALRCLDEVVTPLHGLSVLLSSSLLLLLFVQRRL